MLIFINLPIIVTDVINTNLVPQYIRPHYYK